ncbi:unnamed protein product, partial [Brenthis ino]
MSGREEDPKPPRIQSCSRLRYRSSQETRHPTTAATISLAQRTLKSVPIGPRDHHVTKYTQSPASKDHEEILYHEMSTNEDPVEPINDVKSTGITSGSSCADRSPAAQSSMSPNHQTHPRAVLDQEMLDDLATITQTTLSLTNNLPPEFPQATEQNAEKKHKNLWRFILPPEYDPHDTRWTLKYPQHLPGLVELMPQTGIYVSCGDLKYCQLVSKDCKSLARRLLTEVFNRKALSVCLSMSEKAQDSNNVGSNVRPGLDDHASIVLLNFVLDHGLQHGWNTDLQPILNTLHSKIQEIRFNTV